MLKKEFNFLTFYVFNFFAWSKLTMKYVKGKTLELSAEEYASLVLKDGKYSLDLARNDKELTDEEVEELFGKIRDGYSKNAACSKYGISEVYFSGLCRRNFGTTKITDIRDKLKARKVLEDDKTNK